MPKRPQGQKRTSNARAAMVQKSCASENDVSACANPQMRVGDPAKDKKLSPDNVIEIAKAGAEAKWKERRTDMSNQERLMAALFDNPQREHVDIKFWLGGGIDVANDDVCREAANMLEQMDNSKGDAVFAENFNQRQVSDFIASI